MVREMDEGDFDAEAYWIKTNIIDELDEVEKMAWGEAMAEVG